MSDHLEYELSVPPLEEKLTRRRSAEGQTTEDKGPGAESEILLSFFPPYPDQFDSIELAESLARDFQASAGFLFDAGPNSSGAISRHLRIGQRSPRTFPRGDMTMIKRCRGSGSMVAVVVGASSLQGFEPTGFDCPISAQLRPNGVMFGYFSLARTTRNHEDTKLELP